MGQIFVNAVTKYFGAEKLLEDISFTVGTTDRFGLVGPNGCGKTTLLRILMGKLEYDSGKISFEGKSTVGYFSQNRSIDISEDSMIDYLRKGFSEIIDIWDKLIYTTKKLESNPHDESLIETLSKLQTEFEAGNGFEIDHRINKILMGLGFPAEDWDRPISSLSGGERSRLQLSRVLALSPDTLILDEPTNHLDLKSVMWLEDYLADYKGSVLLISHDRFLLDRICNKIGFIENRKIKVFRGNYTLSKQQNDIEKQLQGEEAKKQQEFLEKAKRYIAKFKRIGTPKASAKARQMESRVGRLEIVEEPMKEKDIKLQIKSTGRTGEVVFKTRNLGMSFENKELFSGINIELYRGQKVALVGANGTGKTTFLKLILEKLTPTAGSIWNGYSVSPTYLEQELASFDKENTILEEIMNDTKLHIPEARDHLARFHFTGDEVFKKCGVLSGGEISRLILSKLALIESNFLIMDEPTNHLDIKARTAIENTLRDYNGTILIVSHDRYFINQVGARIWDLSNNTISDTRMNLEEYFKSKKNTQTKPESVQKSEKTKIQKQEETPKLSKNRIREITEKIEVIEKELSGLANEKDELEARMSNTDSVKMSPEEFKRYSEIGNIEAELMSNWEELSSHLTE
jgi:ATP-binding cassette, subfamily F, member 3